jgi:beta-lactam-binding protein with PASTA domain/serine/threonine protein kinase
VSTYTQRVSSPAVPDLVGEVLDGRYEVLEHLADGGMARVYKARDTRLDREVALKVLRPHLVHDDEFVRRFEREARSAASLQHANIVGVLDYGHDRGHLFIVMEYVAGRTLRQIIDDEGSLTPRAALDLMDPVLDALGHAHRAGLIHRDVKPENVLVRDDGVVKVADFGLVRAVTSQTVTSSSSVLLGTVAYVSPEQVGRGIADARSDVYAAGLILFELLTGTKAFTGELPVNVAFMHVHEDAPTVSSRAAGTPRALDEAVATAAARDPDARPADALAFRSLLATVRRGLTPAQLDRRLGPTGSRATGDTHGAVGAGASTAALPVSSRHQTTTSLPTVAGAGASTDEGDVVAVGARGGSRPPRDGIEGRRRRRWPWVLVALSAALLAATVWAFTRGPLEPTPVPQVTNLEAAKAHQALTAVGLTGRDTQAFSEDVPVGTVISSDPGAGTTIWKWDTVTLVISKGQERYPVPALAGVPLDQALQQLRDGHLSSGTQAQDFSETVPSGSVISSDPVAGTPLPPGGAVNLVVSKGKKPIDVQDFTNKPYADAQAALTGAGLVTTVTEEQNSDSVPKGAVIAQQPAGGQLFKGDTVSFVVSKGPVMVAVPNVVGNQVGPATATLEAAGFKVTVHKLLPGINFGTVQSTDPVAGTQVPKGSTITLKTV